MIILNIWKNNKYSKPPTRIYRDTHAKQWGEITRRNRVSSPRFGSKESHDRKHVSVVFSQGEIDRNHSSTLNFEGAIMAISCYES